MVMGSFLLSMIAGATAASGAPQGPVISPNAVRGKVIFKRMNCAVCHPGGENSVNPKAPIKGAGFKREFAADKSIEKVIRSGIAGTPMPAFNKTQIKDSEMQDLLAYIRSLTPKDCK